VKSVDKNRGKKNSKDLVWLDVLFAFWAVPSLILFDPCSVFSTVWTFRCLVSGWYASELYLPDLSILDNWYMVSLLP
jgi:hypothetical protein